MKPPLIKDKIILFGLIIFFSLIGVVAAQTWTSTGSLNIAREYHTMTLLKTGEVLIAGGLPDSGGAAVSAELYNPTSGTFHSTGNLVRHRGGHTATLLQEPNCGSQCGKVLIAGGGNASNFYGESSAELYDPSTGTFSYIGEMRTPRSQHTATLLPNGKVLIIGGDSGASFLAKVDLYDPATGQFSALPDLCTGRTFHTATLLPTGEVLIVGGYTNGYITLIEAEVYNPSTGPARCHLTTQRPRAGHRDTFFPSGPLSGKVLLTGGQDSEASAEIYDPLTDTFTLTGSMHASRRYHTATLLLKGCTKTTFDSL